MSEQSLQTQLGRRVAIGAAGAVLAPVAEAPAAQVTPVETPVDAPAPVVEAPLVEAPVAPLKASKVGSAAWLLATLRGQDRAFATATDDVLVQIADNMCIYRMALGLSGSELTRVALQSGFTAHQAEVLSITAYIYCTAQEGR
jgi:hypothetical protein